MRIVLIEDEKRMAQALCPLLRLEKYDVDHYANRADGLAVIQLSMCIGRIEPHTNLPHGFASKTNPLFQKN